MSTNRYLIILLVICFCSSCAMRSKQPSIGTHLSELKSVPQLSYQQKLADHDTLVSYIKQVSPIIYYNHQVRHINFDNYACKLRKKIKPNTSMAAYLHIVDMTLNAAQDGHSGRLGSWQLDIMKNNWIPNGIIKDIDSTSIVYGHQYEKFANSNFSAKLDLNLVYTDGEYYNLMPFSYNGENFPASMKLISCNGKQVHKFVKKQLTYISPLRWDRINKRMYHERFYRPIQSYQKDKLNLIFIDREKRKYHLNITKGDTIALTRKIITPLGYNGENSPLITHYFDKEAIFYAKMPMMVEVYGDSLAKKLAPIIAKNQVKAIVIDIRGNGGGSDNTYANFLGRIVRDTLKQDVVVARNFSTYNQKQFKLNTDSVKKRDNFSFDVNVATLKEPKMYYISIANYKFVTPDSINYGFNGKVYILQDRYIYSSASNLSNLASKNEQLVSIGETPDLLGGLQTNPSILQLPYSKIIFRIEPQIDFTDAKTPADAFQNHVEYPVSYTIDELYQRVIAEQDLFGSNYLYQQDPMFKKVLELERLKAKGN